MMWALAPEGLCLREMQQAEGDHAEAITSRYRTGWDVSAMANSTGIAVDTPGNVASTRPIVRGTGVSKDANWSSLAASQSNGITD